MAGSGVFFVFFVVGFAVTRERLLVVLHRESRWFIFAIFTPNPWEELIQFDLRSFFENRWFFNQHFVQTLY